MGAERRNEPLRVAVSEGGFVGKGPAASLQQNSGLGERMENRDRLCREELTAEALRVWRTLSGTGWHFGVS